MFINSHSYLTQYSQSFFSKKYMENKKNILNNQKINELWTASFNFCTSMFFFISTFKFSKNYNHFGIYFLQLRAFLDGVSSGLSIGWFLMLFWSLFIFWCWNKWCILVFVNKLKTDQHKDKSCINNTHSE